METVIQLNIFHSVGKNFVPVVYPFFFVGVDVIGAQSLSRAGVYGNQRESEDP